MDHYLSEDMTLCPVRALRYYLDKTKELRENNHLSFSSFKDGFSKDIQRSTIFSWLKQTVILAYESSDVEIQTLSNVKAHDVRSTAASLAFKGGVSVDQILGACIWKTHSNFTNFYLKDVALKSTEGSGFSFGPVICTANCTMLIKVLYGI